MRDERLREIRQLWYGESIAVRREKSLAQLKRERIWLACRRGIPAGGHGALTWCGTRPQIKTTFGPSCRHVDHVDRDFTHGKPPEGALGH